MQRKYELSISADYVPEWGVTEAVREFFQNAIDEQQRDSGNKMFFDYSTDEQCIRIGNRHSDLNIKTLLIRAVVKKHFVPGIDQARKLRNDRKPRRGL